MSPHCNQSGARAPGEAVGEQLVHHHARSPHVSLHAVIADEHLRRLRTQYIHSITTCPPYLSGTRIVSKPDTCAVCLLVSHSSLASCRFASLL
jgi:hypothetical protein